MKNKVSKYNRATFYFVSILAINIGLSIETFTTIQLKSVDGPAASISETVLVLTLTSLFLVLLNQKNFNQKKIVAK